MLGMGCSVPVWADAGLSIGVLGGALVGSLVGQPKNRVQNALIGAVAGGALTEMSRSGAQERYATTVYQPAHASVTTIYGEPVAPAECRQMQTQGYIDGRQETLTGLACRAPGSSTWQYQDTPRIVQRVVTQQQPQTVIVEQAPRTMTLYPAQTVVIEPMPVVAYPVVTVTAPPRGRYYGHRDVWREEHHRRLDW